ncbi:protein TolR [Arsenicitalea aurantiaca]|uniref:Protein TolR n=1 Tax=Arsenicitalea aurantiaca TaxID=1783274 RepID=A0A433XKX5_9HYPH|nr:protein TolR [Arsenicitalea aurantiaca]RUT34658.1 protein TolR [Arsenicitalea aurantiaca]
MGMSVGGGGGGNRRRGRRRGGNAIMSEINVTPLVDVMLVLLIVFMVAAPMMTVGVPIDLPQSQARQMNTEAQPITVSVTPDGQVWIGEDVVPIEQLVAQVNTLTTNGTEDRIYVRGDTSADYGSVMRVMGLLSGAGYSRIGLITQQEQQ